MPRHLLPLLVLSLAGCGRHEPAPPAQPPLPTVSVEVQKVNLEPHVAVEEVVGTVRSKLRALVESKVSGRVVEYHATPGGTVKAGDLLARLEVQEIQARLEQATAMRDQAQRDFERQRQLLASNATTRQEYDGAEARLKVAVAGVKEAETMLGYASVTAPFDGVVTRKLADVGDLSMPGKPLLEIEAPTALRFEADLPEAILERVEMGAKMMVRVASVPQPLAATVSEIAPVADAVSRTFQVKFDLPQAPELRTGQFGRVAVPVAEVKVLRVPEAAVMKRGQMEVLFVRQDAKALLRLVKTGKLSGGAVEILSGLEQGEEVIISGMAELSDGQPVTLKQP